MSTESNNKTLRRDAETASRVAKTARITGRTPRQVYRVITGERHNEQLLDVYMAIQESEKYVETLLIHAVKNAVPFNSLNRLS